MIEIKCMQGSFYISSCDYEFVSKFVWDIGNNGYVYRRSDKKLLHRILLNEPKNKVVDHKDNNPLNNTRENLRVATYAENSWNHTNKKAIKKGKYGWEFCIMKHGIRHYFGQFKTKEEAMIMYNRKARKLHGEFAFLFDIDDNDEEIKTLAELKKKSKYKYVSPVSEKRKGSKRWQVSIKGVHYGYFYDELEAYEFTKIVNNLFQTKKGGM